MKTLTVSRISDFEISGAGEHATWSKIDWVEIDCAAHEKADFYTRFKVAYSETGLYVLFDCEDSVLTCTDLKDFDDLYEEDVVEFFIWPDETQRIYFEHETSPLGAELPILVANNGTEFMGWRPWHYDGARRCQVKTQVRGGDRKPGAKVSAWSAEIKLPFDLLKGLGNNRPVSGTRWRANFYRIDYGQKKSVHWMWSPIASRERGYHDIDRFGTLVFS